MLLSTYDFQYPIMLLFLQNMIAVFLVELAKKTTKTVKYDGFNMEVALEWLPVNLAF
eukprot:SAG22_NODE_15883_length_338_cov_0.644351_1_plen_56_part_01